MILSGRQQELLNMIKEARTIRVQELIDTMSASAATVRRDIAFLESEGLIFRTRGEVHLAAADHAAVPPYYARSTVHSQAKNQIAKYALEMVEDHMNIAIDSGSTTAAFAQKLVERRLTVATNSLDVSYILAKSPSQVISCGGLLQSENMCFVGPEAQSFFSKIEVDIAFLGASGLRASAGLTTSSPLQYDIKRAILRAANRRYVLMDSSKLLSSHLYVFAEFSEIDAIITNAAAPGSEGAAVLQNLQDAGIQVICTP